MLGEPAPGLLHAARERLGDGAPVERVGTAFGHLTQRRRELLVDDEPPGAQGPVAEIEPLRFRRASERRARLLEEVDILPRERHPALRVLDRGREHRRARHRSEALEGGEPPAEVAGRRARLRTAGELVVGAARDVGGTGRTTDEVEDVALARRGP